MQALISRKLQLPNYTFWKNFKYILQSKIDPVIAVLAQISHKLSAAGAAMSRIDYVALGLDVQGLTTLNIQTERILSLHDLETPHYKSCEKIRARRLSENRKPTAEKRILAHYFRLNSLNTTSIHLI
jgi:hypothetical protein